MLIGVVLMATHDTSKALPEPEPSAWEKLMADYCQEIRDGVPGYYISGNLLHTPEGSIAMKPYEAAEVLRAFVERRRVFGDGDNRVGLE